MKQVTKAIFGALALAGAVSALSAPAMAQSDPYNGYYGPDPYGPPGTAAAPYANATQYADPYAQQAPDPYAQQAPYADPYAYQQPYPYANADPYACDYYNPPWGYPPDYCAYQVWQEPIYVGGLWYSGPIYYRNYGGGRQFWLNGGWRGDEWRGARPAQIDWGRNMRWSGSAIHGG